MPRPSSEGQDLSRARRETSPSQKAVPRSSGDGTLAMWSSRTHRTEPADSRSSRHQVLGPSSPSLSSATADSASARLARPRHRLGDAGLGGLCRQMLPRSSCRMIERLADDRPSVGCGAMPATATRCGRRRNRKVGCRPPLGRWASSASSPGPAASPLGRVPGRGPIVRVGSGLGGCGGGGWPWGRRHGWISLPVGVAPPRRCLCPTGARRSARSSSSPDDLTKPCTASTRQLRRSPPGVAVAA